MGDDGFHRFVFLAACHRFQIAVDCINELSWWFLRIRKIGSDHVADIAHNGHTTSVTIDQSTAKDFRKGLLSIDNLLNMSDS